MTFGDLKFESGAVFARDMGEGTTIGARAPPVPAAGPVSLGGVARRSMMVTLQRLID